MMENTVPMRRKLFKAYCFICKGKNASVVSTEEDFSPLVMTKAQLYEIMKMVFGLNHFILDETFCTTTPSISHRSQSDRISMGLHIR